MSSNYLSILCGGFFFFFLSLMNRCENWGSEMFGNICLEMFGNPRSHKGVNGVWFKPRSAHLLRPPSFPMPRVLPRGEKKGNGKKTHKSQFTETTPMIIFSSWWHLQDNFSSAWMSLWLTAPRPLSDSLHHLNITLITFHEVWFLLCPLSSAIRLSGFQIWRLILGPPELPLSQPKWEVFFSLSLSLLT